MCQYVVLDLEMCRIPKKKKEDKLGMEIIEIGAVLLGEDLEIKDTFMTYVCPQTGFVDDFIKRLTGITRQDTKNAPKLEEAMSRFAEWIPEDSYLVTWSGSDETQIRREFEAKKILIPKISDLLDTCIDCQEEFAEVLNSQKTYSLSEALIIADIDYDENIHDALVDAKNTALLFAKMESEEDFTLSRYYAVDDDSSNGLLGKYSH